jgi:ATP-dependent DNA helicase RecQ
MNSILFIDTEIDVKSKIILDIGCSDEHGKPFHSSSKSDFIRHLYGKKYICGHNIIKHDLPILEGSLGVDFSHHYTSIYHTWQPELFKKRFEN